MDGRVGEVVWRSLWWVCVPGCGSVNEPAPKGGDSAAPVEEVACVPRDEAPSMPGSANNYADLCSRLLGRMPVADCGMGVRIPITVDGVEVLTQPPDNRCDHTGFKGDCAPGSTIRRQEGVGRDGSPRPEVSWITFCRAVGGGLGSVQMIGHDSLSGATCFFESPDAIGSSAQRQWVSMSDAGALSGRLPAPGSADFDTAFIPPPGPCSECHHNDPFIHNSWIDGARLPEDPSQPVLPVLATPTSPYWVVGGPNWDLRTPHIEGNQCVACHRLGTATIDIFDSLGAIDINETMPPTDPGSGTEDLEALQTCWVDGPEDTPGCTWDNPPGAYCD